MSQSRCAVRRLLALLSGMLLMACVLASVGQADPYGELAHFGDKGELQAPEAAIGVNPEDNSLYIVDQEKEGVSFRIQKFEKVSGTYKPVASASFRPKDPQGEEEDEVEGVAVNPKTGVVYVLALEARPYGEGKIDPGSLAAGQLYAFKAAQNGTKLEFASGTEEGVLTNTKVLEPLSNKFGHSILYPGGITVDPANGNILIAGYEDRGKLTGIEEQTPIVQAIEASGKLGPRWADEKEFFEECGCINSPVVSSSGHIYVLGQENEIDEIPASLAAGTAPKRVFQQPSLEFCNENSCSYVEKLTRFPGEGGEEGAQMSIGPEGKIFVRDRIKLASEGNNSFAGVLVLGPEFVEQGFIGGGSSASESTACAVNEQTLDKPKLAVGKEEAMFLLSRPFNKTAKVLELGPGGENCPHATATTPTAKSGAVELERFPLAGKVTFSSTVTQANATSVEWEFADGSATQTVGTHQQETTSVEHKFLKEGKFTVTEKIHTDNLATPLITKTRAVTILGAPTVRAEEAIVEGTTVKLKGEVNPNLESSECRFEYGPAGEAFPTSKKVACPTAPGEGEEAVVETTTVTGLEAGREYHFRIFAKSASGETLREGTKFVIPGAGPGAETRAASSVGQSTATLNGAVNPKGEATSCKFEYGTSLPSGKEVPCSSSPGSGTSSVAVSAVLSGLTPGTTYHFKLIASNGQGTNAGVAAEFLAAAKLAPVAETGSASALTQTTATLSGTVNPKGETTACKFEYGTSLPSGKEVPCSSSPGGGTSSVAVSASISGLSPSTVYRFRLLAENTNKETSTGTSVEFKTASPPPSGGGGGGGGTITTPGGGGVLPHTEHKAVPNVSVAGTAITVAANGAFSLKLSCTAEEPSCAGSVTLKTLTAVAASAHTAKSKHKAILTLASGSFTIAGGKLKALSLHLSTKARALLAKSHSLRARVTVLAHDSAGGTHTTTVIVTLKAAKKKH